MRTKYLGQPVTLEYERDGSSSPTTYSPMYGAEGGDSYVYAITAVYDDQDRLMLYTQRQMEIWEEFIALNDDRDLYDYPDWEE